MRRLSKCLLLCFLCFLTHPLLTLSQTTNLFPSMPQQAYVWQRDWDRPVRRAVADQARHFSGLVVLNAEVTWARGKPRLVRVPLDFATLRSADCPVGLALRIGPFSGPFNEAGEPIESLAALAASLIDQAKVNGLTIAELQVDFDCADSKLAGYQRWVETLRARVAPTTLSITALPSWLSQPAFKGLASAAGSLVLQVHSLERPKSFTHQFSLCDPAAAHRAVQRAAELGVPFRVALPTYGYVIAFDRTGKFIGLSAEGPLPGWPEVAKLRDVRSNPQELAELVRSWAGQRPANFQGVIWYRLPTGADTLNWRWPTLQAVMAGRPPREHLRATVVRPEAGLVEISLLNDGEADSSASPAIAVHWHNAELIAADATRGFEIVRQSPKSLHFQTAPGARPPGLAAGTKRSAGWLRLSTNEEVHLEILQVSQP